MMQACTHQMQHRPRAVRNTWLLWLVKSVAMVLVALTGVLTLDAPSHASEWPSRPVKIVVPYGAGGSTDITARIMGDRLSRVLGQPVIVENRPGAGGAIGTEYAVRSAADGYTLYLAAAQQFAVTPLTQRLSYDPITALSPISIVGVSGMILAIRSDIPARTVTEFIAYAKARPGKLNYSHAGVGTTSHIAAAAFASVTDIDMTAIPYQSAPAAVNALLSGSVEVYFGNVMDLLEPGKSPQIRFLAVSTEQPIAQLPNTPTLASILPGFVMTVWQGFFAPAQTPSPIIERLARELNAICQDPALVKRLSDIGIDAVGNRPADVTETLRRELPLYKAAVYAAGIAFDQQNKP